MDLINIGIIITYIMIIGAALAVVGFSVMQMMKSPKNSKKTLYTVGGLVIVLILAYFLASSEVLPSYEKYGIDSASAKRVGMGLNAFYFLAIGAVLVVLYTEFGKAFKK
ncbi:MAG: hypothetical protein H8E84_02515 [Flavobacteriales bacterium]|nr:hypothetical protein [Flavobacteriales bacterium]